MNKWVIRLVALGGFVAVGAQVQAHHAVASVYDLNTEVVLEGRLTELNYRNPHSNIHLSVTEEDGNTVEWVLTTASVRLLRQAGLNSDTLQPGDSLRVTILPARNGNPAGFLRRLELSDHQFELGID